MEQRQTEASPRQAKRYFWEQQIKDWKDSGLTQGQYCQKRNLKMSTFLYWRRKLDLDSKKNLLIPVSIQPESEISSTSVSSGVSLTFNDCLIQIHKGFDQNTLLELLQVLRVA